MQGRGRRCQHEAEIMRFHWNEPWIALTARQLNTVARQELQHWSYQHPEYWLHLNWILSSDGFHHQPAKNNLTDLIGVRFSTLFFTEQCIYVYICMSEYVCVCVFVYTCTYCKHLCFSSNWCWTELLCFKPCSLTIAFIVCVCVCVYEPVN